MYFMREGNILENWTYLSLCLNGNPFQRCVLYYAMPGSTSMGTGKYEHLVVCRQIRLREFLWWLCRVMKDQSWNCTPQSQFHGIQPMLICKIFGNLILKVSWHKSLFIFLKLASGQKEQLFWANISWSVCVLLLVLWEFNIYVLQLYSE